MVDREWRVTDDELHAYVDGELREDRRKVVESWLTAHPDDAARVASWRAHADLIRVRYGGIGLSSVPARLDLDRLARAERKWTWIAAAAVVAAFLIGNATGWLGHSAFAPASAPVAQEVTADALDAHKLYVSEVRHPIEVPADASHLLPWLSKRLNSTLRTPDLAPFGLKLMGGRLLPGLPGRPAAMFMYENAAGDRYTLYCAQVSVPQTALHYNAAGQVAAVYWGDGDLGFVVSGPADRERLLKIAQSAYEQLDRRTQRGSS